MNSGLNSIPGFVGDAKLGQVHIDINEVVEQINNGELVSESVGVEVEGIQSKTNKALSSPQLTLEEKEEILLKLEDIYFLEALMVELSVDTSKMLLIIENSNILYDSKSGYQIHIQLDTGDNYYIDSSTYNKVLNSHNGD